MKCIFEKKIKKNEEGAFAVFWDKIYEKKRRGDPSSKKEGGKSEGSPLRRFFWKKFEHFIDILVVSTLESNADSKSVVRLS